MTADSIESPQGGITAAPPPLEELGLMSRGLRRLAIETGIVWLGKFSASSRHTCSKSYENLEFFFSPHGNTLRMNVHIVMMKQKIVAALYSRSYEQKIVAVLYSCSLVDTRI